MATSQTPESMAPEDRQHRRLDLREEGLNRTIWALAYPTILANLMFTVVFVADTLIVGWLRDENALAATSLTGVFMWFFNSPFFALSIAANSLVSRCWGERDFRSARRFAGQAMSLAFVLALSVVAVAWLLAEDIVRLLGASETVYELGGEYLRIVLYSSVLGVPMIVATGILRGSGDTRTPMFITLVMNVVNVIASVALAFGMGPFPELGLMGVGWGTVIARTLGGVLALACLFWRGAGIGMALGDIFSVERLAFARVWGTGFPIMLDRMLNTTAQLIFIRIVAGLGTTMLAAHQIALQVESLAFMPVLGIGAAAATVMGQCIGSRLTHIAELAVKRTLFWSVAIMTGLSVLFVLGGPTIASWFRATPAVVALAGLALIVSALELPFLAFSIVLGQSLRGAGDTRSPLIVSIFSIVVFRLGAVYLFAHVFEWGLEGVWLATALDWAARAAGLWFFFKRGPWKLIHEQEKQRYK